MTRSLVIVNPAASRARDPRRRAHLTAALREVLGGRDGADPVVVETSAPGQVGGIVRAHVAEGLAAVVGVGGDGTLREIADCLAGTVVPLGIVPAGTGNVLGGALGVPDAPARAVEALAEARPRWIDLGLAELDLVEGGSSPAGQPAASPVARTFAISCGLGFDARVMAATPADLKRRYGRAAYYAEAVRQAARIGVVPYRLTIDGQEVAVEASVAFVANLGQLIPGILGPRLPIVPDDGLLDVFVLGARHAVDGVRGLLDHLWRTRLGEGTGTLRARGRDVILRAEVAEPLQVDGDHVGSGSIRARVRPAALGVLVPPRATVRRPADERTPAPSASSD